MFVCVCVTGVYRTQPKGIRSSGMAATGGCEPLDAAAGIQKQILEQHHFNSLPLPQDLKTSLFLLFLIMCL